MTDKDKLVKLLTEFDIEFIVSDDWVDDVTSVLIEEGKKNVGGVSDHYINFEFNPEDGSFLQVGAYS